ncbi:class I SAM-dependent methyltransferase [Phyllobacterium salinisoli]|uniref:Class I SAM-dependent methyltransferase n=1 Tax=Phyllobacterium salinisoli TaxID=1899321 RepID=A0A368K4B3_9HYPH|nr:class I SAM-dependent methyltransferase [Phyllobacterium salinisoli]RCS23323.1 class I SAM-dependent methyltransferase [Phyllobacterium salinisoli]
MDPSAYTEIYEVENKHWWFIARRKIIEGVIRSLDLPPESNILELGAGTGGNLEMLSRFGKVRAAEMDDYAREMAIKQTGGKFDVQYGCCPEIIPFEGVKFDLICMFDVLEHIFEDVETLSALKRRLAPKGRLLITVPAYQWMWCGHDEFLHHMRRYTSGELSRKLRKTGYHVRKITYFNSLLFPLAALVRVKDRLTSKKVESVNQLPSPMLNEWLEKIFACEARLVKNSHLPFGVSLLAIAENT